MAATTRRAETILIGKPRRQFTMSILINTVKLSVQIAAWAVLLGIVGNFVDVIAGGVQ